MDFFTLIQVSKKFADGCILNTYCMEEKKLLEEFKNPA